MITLIIGASANPDRYSYKAAYSLAAHRHEIVLLGAKKGELLGQPIHEGFPLLEGIDTVTLYLNPTRQEAYYDYIIGLSPRRILFNPGTENPAFVALAAQAGIACENACTLVLLATNTF